MINKKRKIVLINPVNPDPPPNYFGPPYGISLIGACLLADARPTQAYDFDLEPMPLMLSSVKEIIARDRPAHIGICIQSCTRGPVYELIDLIRQADRSITIILGGPFASLKYDMLLRNFSVDYVVIGDAEKTLVELLNCLDDGGDPGKVNGIAFLVDGRVCATAERKKETNLDLLPYPAFGLFNDFAKKINASDKEKIPNFILGKRCTIFKNALLLLSSRGCIYSCNFCPMSGVSADKIRFHSPEYFVDMVTYFHNRYKIKDFVFGDNSFTLVREHALEICERILRKGLKIRWGCMTRSDYVDQPLLKKMAAAGCFEISYGVESGSSRIQKMIGKNLDLELTKKAFEMTRAAGIRSILMLMVGNLGECEETIRDTISYVRNIEPDHVLVKIAKVYPGTKIHDIFEKRGLLKKGYYLTSEFHPPSFTLQQPEERLKRFARMLRTRQTFIQLGNRCNNNCVFCALSKKGKGKDTGQIKKELALASTRGECVVLFGGEPFLRKDIFEVIDYAERMRIHQLQAVTNTRVFFYKDLARRLSGTSLRRIIIPFFGFSGLHDKIARFKGAYHQAIEGINNIKVFAPNVKIEAKIFISGQNYRFLPELAQSLSGFGVDEFGFIFFRDSVNSITVKNRDCPSMGKTALRLRKAAALLGGINKGFYFEGMPICMLKEFKDGFSELYTPFNEVIGLDRKISNCVAVNSKERKKFDFCRRCKEEKICLGVWEGYIKLHGSAEFRPC